MSATDRLNRSNEADDQNMRAMSITLKVALALYYFYYSIMHILIMLLIMTMNGFVIISMILGLTVGYVLFEQQDKKKDAVVEELPVNCGGCA